MRSDELRVFERYADRITAEIVAGRLRDAGLSPWVQTDDAGGAYPSVQLERGVRLMLPADEHDAAREVLASTPDVSDIDPGARVEVLSPAFPRWIAGLACFIGGVLVALLLTSPTPTAPSYDENGDGRADVWFVDEGDGRSAYRTDRNFDGKPDARSEYANGVLVESESDENFDDRVDLWSEFRDGRLVEQKVDSDFNGIADVTVHYEHGVVASSEWHPNGKLPPERKRIFENGTLREELSAWVEGKGYTLRTPFDAFQRRGETAPNR